MSEEPLYRATLCRMFHRVKLWELGVVQLHDGGLGPYESEVVSYRELGSGYGMTPSICARNKALREMGFEIARYQAWDWFETSMEHGEPGELIGRVRVVKLPGAVTIVDDEEEYRDAGV